MEPGKWFLLLGVGFLMVLFAALLPYADLSRRIAANSRALGLEEEAQKEAAQFRSETGRRLRRKWLPIQLLSLLVYLLAALLLSCLFHHGGIGLLGGLFAGILASGLISRFREREASPRQEDPHPPA